MIAVFNEKDEPVAAASTDAWAWWAAGFGSRFEVDAAIARGWRTAPADVVERKEPA